jgi:thymidylate synthase
MKQYLELMRTVLESGTDRGDRTGVGTRSIDQARLQLTRQPRGYHGLEADGCEAGERTDEGCSI